MVLFDESRNDAEANIAVAGTGAAAQQRVVPKRSLNAVITFAYVYHQAEKILAPCGTLQSITELAAHLSTHMQLVVPRQQLIEPPPPPAQMLRFTNEIPAEIFTNDTIVLKIELVNIEPGLICSTGEPASPLKVEIFITRGSFPSKDRKLRKCKPLCPRNKATMPLLVQVTGTKTARRGCSFKNKFELRNGRAVVKVKITDNSSWVRSKMFKLVARVVKGSYQGRRIKEALSEAFAVKEAKLKGKKADVPSPTDPTSKLNNVGKKYYKILQDMGINTVHDFLNKLESDPEGLKATVGMQNAKWESTVDHARRCIVSLEQEPSMTETNEETFAPGQDINVQQEPSITDLLHTPEIQAQYMVMGQQRDPAAGFGSDYSNPISSLNGNNGSLVFCSSPFTVSMPPLPISCSTASYEPHPVFCSFPSTVPMPPLPISRSIASYWPHSGEVFGQMPEQASTGEGMTMVNGSNLNQGPLPNFPSPENNQWNFIFGSPSNNYEPQWN